jgi:hypothetical protein
MWISRVTGVVAEPIFRFPVSLIGDDDGLVMDEGEGSLGEFEAGKTQIFSVSPRRPRKVAR